MTLLSSGQLAVARAGSASDARLIAAAPDLLASAKEAVEYWEAGESDDNVRANIAALRAAIRKSEGK